MPCETYTTVFVQKIPSFGALYLVLPLRMQMYVHKKWTPKVPTPLFICILQLTRGCEFFKFLMKLLCFQHITVLDYAFFADLKALVLHSILWRFPDK